MTALCRHVKQNKSQTDTNFLRVGTCKSVFTGSAQPVICCETVRRQKQKLYKELLSAVGKRLFSAVGKRPQMRNIANFLGLQAHSEIVTVEVQFVPPSELTGLMKEHGLIRCLRNKVKPRSVMFLYPTLPRYLVTWKRTRH